MTRTIEWHVDEQRGVARHDPTGVEFLVAAGGYFGAGSRRKKVKTRYDG